MALLTAEQKKSIGPLVNGFGFIFAVAFTVALACKFILSGYPPIIAWMEPFNELAILLGAIIIGVVVYDRNKLVK